MLFRVILRNGINKKNHIEKHRKNFIFFHKKDFKQDLLLQIVLAIVCIKLSIQLPLQSRRQMSCIFSFSCLRLIKGNLQMQANCRLNCNIAAFRLTDDFSISFRGKFFVSGSTSKSHYIFFLRSQSIVDTINLDWGKTLLFTSFAYKNFVFVFCSSKGGGGKNPLTPSLLNTPLRGTATGIYSVYIL